MDLGETIRKLLRRWYILLAGMLLAVGAAAGVWLQVSPGFERTASLVLLPGRASLPEPGHNPYLYIGGLTQAADVVVRAVGSKNTLHEITEDFPGTAVEVTRDPTTAGPLIRIAVTAPSDDEAAAVLALLVERTGTELELLQNAELIPDNDRISIVPVTIDAQSEPKNRTRLILSAGAGIAVVGLTLVLAAMLEGLSRRRVAPAPPSPESEPDRDAPRLVRDDGIPHLRDPGDASAAKAIHAAPEDALAPAAPTSPVDAPWV